MTLEDLWMKTNRLATTWRLSPIVSRFNMNLPRNGDPRQGLPEALQHVEAKYHFIGPRPLRVGSLLPAFGELDSLLGSVGAEQFMDDAARIDTAAHRLIAWLRAQLPGYPTFPVPQLAFGSSRMNHEFTWTLPWLPEAFRSGLQFTPYPDVVELLDISAHATRLRDDSVQLAAALAGTDSWRAFAGALEALNDDDREALRASRAALRARLSDHNVDAHEPTLTLRRAEYRQRVTEEIVSELTGQARHFADSFERVERTIDQVADVFGQLTCYGAPTPLGPVTDLSLTPDGAQFAVDGWREVGALYRVEDSLAPDVLHAVGAQMNFGAGGDGVTTTLKCDVLADSATTLP